MPYTQPLDALFKLPDELDSDGELLQRYDLDPDELRDEFEGQSPAATY